MRTLFLIFSLFFVAPVHAGDIPPYDRSEWGGWPDEDGDCQDLRAEFLIAQSRVPVTFRSDRACVVATGEWIGAYSGDLFTDARDVEIDHVVPPQWLDVRPRFRAAYLATWKRVRGKWFR